MAVTLGPGQSGQIWILDLNQRSRPLKLTSQGHNVFPTWTRDGKRVVFRSVRATGIGLLSIAADGTEAQPTEIDLQLIDADRGQLFPHDFTADGQLLFSSAKAGTRQDLMLASIEQPVPTIVPWLATEAAENGARFSPDGRYLAYVSDSTGTPEVWIRSFPGPGAPARVSETGGREPLWSPDGRELFFQSGPAIMAVTVRMGEAGIEISKPMQLFSGGFAPFQTTVPRSYDVLPDGGFVMIQLEGDDIRETIAVKLNWFEELSRRVPLRD